MYKESLLALDCFCNPGYYKHVKGTPFRPYIIYIKRRNMKNFYCLLIDLIRVSLITVERSKFIVDFISNLTLGIILLLSEY